MKKKSINLKKLSLNKERLGMLNPDQQGNVLGGNYTQVAQNSLCVFCTPNYTQQAQDSFCVFCTPNFTQQPQDSICVFCTPGTPGAPGKGR